MNVFRCDSSLFLVIFEVFDPKLPSLSASLPSFTPAPRTLFASSLKSQISVKSLWRNMVVLLSHSQRKRPLSTHVKVLEFIFLNMNILLPFDPFITIDFLLERIEVLLTYITPFFQHINILSSVFLLWLNFINHWTR